jgi:4-amino-4-deoxy-L-arabinose transferase-like glycosyltransferase
VTSSRFAALPRWQTHIILLAAISIVLLVNPFGFSGGGNDNGRYLEAARCWVANGICLPSNHWASRWPVFAPIALITGLVGETRTSVQLWPLLCSVVAVMLLARLGERLFDRRTGVVAGLLLIFIPVFGLRILTPGVEAIELCCLFAGILCILGWRDVPTVGRAFAAGICFGLAFQVRETSLVSAFLATITAFALGLRPKMSHLTFAAAGFALPLAIEFAAYQFATGDFLFRRHLALSHARDFSSELSASVDTSRSPFFNPDLIAGWKIEPGLHVHWLIDGPLNLLVTAGAGFSLLIAPLLLIAARQTLSPPTRRAAWLLLALAAAYVAIITYALAMDPSPRVMLPALSASTLALALVSLELFDKGLKPLVVTAWLATTAGSLVVMLAYIRPSWAEQQARRWAAQHPQEIETNHLTRLMLTLIPEVRSMPGFQGNRPYAMIITRTECHLWIADSQLDPASLTVADARSLTLFPTGPRKGAWICLFRYRSPVAPEAMQRAISLNWRRPPSIELN